MAKIPRSMDFSGDLAAWLLFLWMSEFLEAPKSGMLELSRTMLAWDPKSLILGFVFFLMVAHCAKWKVKS